MSSRIYETAIKVGATIAKAFKSDTLTAAAALTKLTDATKRMKEAEKAAASYKKLDVAIAGSKARYDQDAAALRKLEDAEKKAGGATKESTAWRKAGAAAVLKASREMDRATKAAEKNGKALRDMGVDTSNLAKEQERLARTLAATERQEKSLSRFEASRQRLFGDRKTATPLADKARSQIGGIARDVAILGTAALGAGAAMAGLVYKTLKAGDEIGDTAEKLGIGSTALQELRYGARQSGDEVGAIDIALKKMAITVGKFKAAHGKGGGGSFAIAGLQMLGAGGAGGGPSADPFKQIGLSAKVLAALKPEEKLKKIADALVKLKTHDERAAVATAIFGKGATGILPFLELGSAGIDKLSKNAHKFGGVMSEEAVKAADEADKAMKDAEMAVTGLTNTLGSALLPTATKVFKEFSGWVADNRGEIRKWAEGAATWIEDKGIPAIVHIGGEVKSFAGKVMHLVGGAAKLVGGFDNLAIAVAALRLAPLVTTLGKIGIEGFKAAAAMFRYAAATRAAKLAEGGGEGGPGGVPGVGASALKFLPVVGAAIAGGVALSKVKIPGLGDFTVADLGITGEGFNKEKFQKLLADQAVKTTGLPRTGAAAGGGGVRITTGPVTIQDGTRADVASALDQAHAEQKAAALQSYDDRVSFND